MSSSSGRAQAEPLVALVCVAVLCVALAGYATASDAVLPTTDRDHAPAALAVVADDLVRNSVADPDRLERAAAASPIAVNATLSVGNETWQVGPVPPARADAASRPVAVRTGPGTVALGTLRVVAW